MPVLSNFGEEPSGQAWRLETFDLRAGLAFATYREARQLGAQDALGMADWPCLFFSPPGFDPQPVDNVALALAASRGSFDSGLVLGEEEVGFAEPAEIAEFMRRAYVASAGGDGADAPGGPEVPPPPEGPDGPDRPEVPPFIGGEELEKYVEPDLRWAMEAFNEQAAKGGQAPGRAAAMAFAPSWGLIHVRAARAAMARGARHLLAELLDRCPGPHETESLLRWDDDLRRLGIFARRCSVFEALADDDLHSLGRRISSTIWRLRGVQWELEYLSGSEAITVLLAAPRLLRSYPTDFNRWSSVVCELRFFGHWALGDVDVVDSLARWPAPGCTQALGPKEPAGRCSTLAMLSAVTSAPEALSQLNPEGVQVALDVAVFASACLTCSEDIGLASGYHWLHQREWDEAVARKCAHRAMDWLVAQFPRLGFRIELEQRISAARHLRYGQVMPTVTSTPTPPSASGAAWA